MGEHLNKVDVYQCVNELRPQRANMIETKVSNSKKEKNFEETIRSIKTFNVYANKVKNDVLMSLLPLTI